MRARVHGHRSTDRARDPARPLKAGKPGLGRHCRKSGQKSPGPDYQLGLLRGPVLSMPFGPAPSRRVTLPRPLVILSSPHTVLPAPFAVLPRAIRESVDILKALFQLQHNHGVATIGHEKVRTTTQAEPGRLALPQHSQSRDESFVVQGRQKEAGGAAGGDRREWGEWSLFPDTQPRKGPEPSGLRNA